MATKKTATKATEVKEVEVKVEEPKKTTKKATTTTKKATTKKVTATVNVQYMGNEISVTAIEENVKAAFVAEGHELSTIKTLTIYVKPEEYAAYYVINDEFTGRVYLF